LIRSLDLIPERRPWSIRFTAPFWNERRPFIKKWPQPLDRREPECRRIVDSLIFLLQRQFKAAPPRCRTKVVLVALLKNSIVLLASTDCFA
jgi:hypothetical protein